MEVRAVLGLGRFFWKNTQEIGKKLERLHQLLPEEKKFLRTKVCEDALRELKGKLPQAPLSGYQKNREG